MSDQTALFQQSELADRLGISQGWLSEATSEGKRVAEGSFDPSSYAVYTEGGRLKGYRLPVDHELATSRPESPTDGLDTELAPSSLAGSPPTVPASVLLPALRSHSPELRTTHNETTTISLFPPGTDVARTSGYAATGYAAAQFAQANPEVVPMLVRALGTGAGAVVGYDVRETAGAALLGAAVGFLVTGGIQWLYDTRVQQPAETQPEHQLPPVQRSPMGRLTSSR